MTGVQTCALPISNVFNAGTKATWGGPQILHDGGRAQPRHPVREAGDPPRHEQHDEDDEQPLDGPRRSLYDVRLETGDWIVAV